MIHKGALAAMALIVTFGAPFTAAGQGRPNAMTCDYYDKQVGAAITRTRRADAQAREEALAQGAQAGQMYSWQQDAPAGPPERDYSAVRQYRREGQMACARRNYEEGINAYANALNLLGIDADNL